MPETPDAIPSLAGFFDTDEDEIKRNAPLVSRDPYKMQALGQRLMAQFERYEKDRRLSELKWLKNYRQFIGEYDPEVDSKLDINRSKAYPKLTRVKVISMLSRLMNLLFPTSEKNWTLEPSPVPNLSTEDLASVLNKVQQQLTAQMQAAQSGQSPTEAAAEMSAQAQPNSGQSPPENPEPTPELDEMIEMAIRAFAAKSSCRLEREIQDQLAEVGGTKQLNYVALCRRVLLSGIMYGAGTLKGPMVRIQKQRRWQITPPSQIQTPQGMEQQPLKIDPIEVEAYRPHFEFVPIWDYYPDMSARYLHQMDGQFHRLVLSRQQVRELAELPQFFDDVVEEYLRTHSYGNYRERTFERELRTLGIHLNVNPNDGRKYEIYVWDGFVQGQDLKAAGVDLTEEQADDMVEASVWVLDNRVIRAELSPWVELEPEQRVKMYHTFIFEEDESQLLGNGLPNIMRDSQMGMSSATRMLMDNASIVCGPNLEVNTDLLDPAQDLSAIAPYKIWYREGTGVDMQYPAVKTVEIDAHIEELQKVVEMFRNFADMETFVNPATGGDMQKGPSEPFRTAAGASMLRGDAALPFKDVVRNFDVFTISVMNGLLTFNRHFNTMPEAKGDHQVIARGASSLIAKEVRGMAYDMLAQTINPKEEIYIDWKKLLKDRLAVRDINAEDVMVDEDEANRREQAAAQQQQEQADQMRELFKAEVRKLLADATKSLTQSDKNTASGQVATYNAILKGLEDGVSPSDVDSARTATNDQAATLPRTGRPAPAGNGAAAPIPAGADQGEAAASFGG